MSAPRARGFETEIPYELDPRYGASRTRDFEILLRLLKSAGNSAPRARDFEEDLDLVLHQETGAPRARGFKVFANQIHASVRAHNSRWI